MGERLWGARCPACGADNDGQTKAMGPGSPVPEPGNASVCFYCLAIGIFTEDLQIRLATKDELKDIMADQEFRRLYLLLGQASVAVRERVARQAR
jgi:hypothetical protein